MIALPAVIVTIAPAAPAAPCTAPGSAERVAGQWTGSFAGADWTFDLVPEGEGWRGRHRTTKAPTWKPLEAVAVTGGCATFSLQSQPRVTFALALAPDGSAMAGDVTIAGLATLPFTARREP
ncbi:hypothetical protein [Sphingomonas hankookensis]|uniref:Uncharacterized protein n=1 Tax=Sphingomonas hengshuiensis TaxID=1609977 RepID=A0A2W4Z3A3_9SPHN|nr:MAG: hypothetical protein DI632_11035 [Sphingomonas hengshuiensis]